MGGELKINTVILAGGMGKRLWPLSRRTWPKYMLRPGMDKSLLQAAWDRVAPFGGSRRVVTSAESGFLVSREIRKKDPGFGEENLILEPLSRNTAPAVMLGIADMEDDDIVAVLPADQVVEGDFSETILKAAVVASQGYIVTIGITPDRPATGYGYIKSSQEKIGEGFLVEEFKEKPDEDTARGYLESGGYFWNAGLFVFRAGTMRREMERHAPEISRGFERISREGARSVYRELPGISIDYAVMEKTDRVAVVPFAGRWDDLGSWESIHRILAAEDGNFSSGETCLEDVSGCFFQVPSGKLVGAAGVRDLIAVDTPDALLLLKKGEGQKVKDLVERLGDDPRAARHLTDYRPWGGYRVLEEGDGYKVKVLFVSPRERLSLQRHKFRDEVWTVIKGKGLITSGEEKKETVSGETVRIPAGALHRAENTGSGELEILELASGEKISEDDIERVEDDYGRR